MTKLDDALDLAKRGFKVFPIKHGAKFPPLLKDWPTHATTDPGQITAWWNVHGDANIGIHTERLLVIDVDVKKDGAFELFELENQRGKLPDTFATLTPTGGRHLFFKLPAGHPGVANGVDVLGPGLDIRSDHGYVVAPGSVVPAGPYRPALDATIAEAPQWLLDACGPTRALPVAPPAAPVKDAADAVVDRAYDWLKGREGAVQGNAGDLWTFETACMLRDMGVSQHQAYLLMLDWNSKCSPPWDLADLERKVANAFAYATGTPGSKAVTPEDFPLLAAVQGPDPSTLRGQPANANTPGPAKLGDFAANVSGGPGYLIKGILSKQSYSVLYGPSGEGKTFVSLDLGYSVAAGLPWMGHKTRQGAVVYVGFEAFGGLPRRAAALQNKYGTGDVPLYFMPGNCNLREPEGRRAFAAELAKLPVAPSLLIFDTLAYALMGADENSNTEVQQFNTAAQALIQATGATVLLIHHTGKDETRGARGAYALKAAVDTEILVNDRRVIAQKQRDMETAPPVAFRLVPVNVGMDADGDMITSCYVEQVTVAASNAVTAKLPANSDLRRAWDVLCEARPTNDPITELEWRQKCEEFLPTKRATKSFYDIKTKLRGRNLIRVDDQGLIQRRME